MYSLQIQNIQLFKMKISVSFNVVRFRIKVVCSIESEVLAQYL